MHSTGIWPPSSCIESNSGTISHQRRIWRWASAIRGSVAIGLRLRAGGRGSGPPSAAARDGADPAASSSCRIEVPVRGSPGDEDRLARPCCWAISGWRLRQSVSSRRILKRVQEIVGARRSSGRACGAVPRHSARRRRSDTAPRRARPPKSESPSRVCASFGDAVRIELDPFGMADLMEGLDPFGPRTGLPDGHEDFLFDSCRVSRGLSVRAIQGVSRSGISRAYRSRRSR